MASIEQEKIDEIYSELAELNASATEIASPDSILDRYTLSGLDDCLVNLYQIFINIEHQGLQALCEILRNNIHTHLLDGTNLSEQECVLFSEWKSLCKAYVNDQENSNVINALLNNLSKDDWVVPIDTETCADLESKLCQPYEPRYLFDAIDEDSGITNEAALSSVEDELFVEDEQAFHNDNPEHVTEIQAQSLDEIFTVPADDSSTEPPVNENLNKDTIDEKSESDPIAAIEEELFSPAPEDESLSVAEENQAIGDLFDEVSTVSSLYIDLDAASSDAIEETSSKEDVLPEIEDELFSTDDTAEDDDFELDQPLLGSHFEEKPPEEIIQAFGEPEAPQTPKINDAACDIDKEEIKKPTSVDTNDNFDDDFFGTHYAETGKNNAVKIVGLGGLDDEKSEASIDAIENELFQEGNDSNENPLSSEEYSQAFEEDMSDFLAENTEDVSIQDSDSITEQDIDVSNSENTDVDYSLDSSDGYNETDNITDIGIAAEDSGETPVEWDEQQQELLTLMLTEVDDTITQQKDNEDLFDKEPVDQNAIRDILSLYVEQIERMGSAAEMVGLLALQQICEFIASRLNQLNAGSITQIVAAHKLILSWPHIISKYLNDIHSKEAHDHIIEYLSDKAWPVPIAPNEKQNLFDAFGKSTISIEKGLEDKRLQVATQDDVSIKVPDDVQAELLDGMLQELPRQTEEFSLAIQNLSGDDYLPQLEVTQRIAHTIKGAANTVGIAGLAILTHNLEDILEALVKSGIKPNAALHNTLIEGADCLEQMSECLLGLGDAPGDALNTLQAILDWANYIDEFGPPAADAEDQAQPQGRVNDTSQSFNKVDDKQDNQNQAQEVSLRVPAGMIDELLKQSGESIIATSQMQDQVSQLVLSMREIKSNRDYVHNLSQKLEHLIDVQGIGGRFLSNQQDQKFDPLEMDQYNELHTYSRRLIEATTDSVELVKQLENKLVLLDSIIADQAIAQKENQYTMLQTRMVPVESIVARLKRGVRQAAKLCNKSVDLFIHGGETLVDSKILTNLIDPLMHLLRNSVDHGIETDVERQECNKALPGKIELTVRQEGDRMIVTCHDDGHGLNKDKILQHAIAQGLVKAEDKLSAQEIYQLILKHGFSTRDEVTQLSGRGVGMDIVFSHIKTLNGTVNIDSVEKQSTTVELSIPVSLLSAHALLVELSKGSIAISTNGVEEIINVNVTDLKREDEKLLFNYEESSYLVTHIEKLLNLPVPKRENENQLYTALMINAIGEQKQLILVPSILSTRDIIIKPFSQYLPKVPGLIGATILGNGEIASVIDARDLLMKFNELGPVEGSNLFQQEKIKEKAKALIVEDSISTRRSLAEFMQDLSYEVYTAKDGIEAIEVIKENQPNILLTDLEMPRMNGLELTSHLRANEATKDIPVIMITSRTTEKHIQEAKSIGVNEYLTKPFQEDLLLEKVSLLAPIV